MTTPTSAGWYPDPDGSDGQRYWDGNSWTNEEPTAVVHLRPVPTEPAAGALDPAPPPSNDGRGLLIKFGAACAALLVILIGLAVYGFLIKKSPEVQLSAPGDGAITTEATQDSGPDGFEPPAPAPPVPPGQATDGPMSFTVHGMEIGPTVGMSNGPLEKNAEGQFVVVHMTVSNTGPDAESFVGMFQTLLSGGTTYPVADEATAYLGGTAAELLPGTATDVSIAFDVPTGTVPEAIELHSEPDSPGVQVPLP
ncbi:DUF4352 domain-containing protein [Mycobacterium sp. NPDC051804]|uniref:DUF4352 domain-containing protein n=1 Tax=Mycobacterium sp. NPDC051804 TaxID=3364295 RepID=UPI0037B001A6